MSDDFRIELGQSVRRHIEHKTSPLADPKQCALPYDQPDKDQIPIFVAESVMRSIESHTLREKDREVGGVLLGGFYRNDNGSFVEITGFIEAKSTKGTDVSLTFTHETWEQITAEQAQLSGDSQIVGWYHSHPALGVFMSREDEFIHSGFFTDPWQVAMVVDPIYHNWGCFKWTDGTLERTGGFYVFADKNATKRVKGYTEKLNTTRQSAPRAASASADRRDFAVARKPVALWVVICILIVSQAVIGYLALTRTRAGSDQSGAMQTAIELLSVCDISGGAQYLRSELVAHPDDDAAYRELDRLNKVLSDPALANESFDNINLMLMSADKLVRQIPKYKQPGDFEGLGLNPDEGQGKLSGHVSEDTPVAKALKIYQSAEATRDARLMRAVAIRSKLGGHHNDAAVIWLKQEPLREIAYGLQSGDAQCRGRLKKLSESDRKAVELIQQAIAKAQRK